jgi:hypothetical protein
MAFELHNQAGALRVSRIGWGKLLELGRMHGWQPAGTEPPQWDEPGMQAAYAEANGPYTSVNGADALALAEALLAALAAIPQQTTGRGRRRAENAAQLDPHDFFAGEHRPRVSEFIAFARLGKFSIRQV